MVRSTYNKLRTHGGSFHISQDYSFSGFGAILVSCTTDDPALENKPVTAKEAQLRVRNELITETQNELKKWFRFYHLDSDTDTLFRLSAIWNVSLLTFPVTDNWRQLYQEHPTLFKPAPDKATILDIYTYERVFNKKRRGKIEVTADSPDSEVAIVEPAKGEKTRLMFCGTPCLFEDAWWRGPNQVVVVGLIQETDQQFYPALWHISLNSNTIRQYSATQPEQLKKNESYLVDEVFDEL